MSADGTLDIAVLISGGGTTLKNLLDRIQNGSLHVRVRLVLSSRADAAGLRYAEQAGIETLVVPRAATPDAESYSEAIFAPCRECGVDVVVMGGFLQHVLIPHDFNHRVLNIHPSLIPSFSGQGFYGGRVHRAVLEYGAKVSGCTVHFVDNEYDHGPIILQRAVNVQPDDTPKSLAATIFRQECEAYPEVLNLLAAGRIHIEGRRVYVAPAAEP